MTYEKQVFITIWTILLIGCVIYLIKKFSFLKRKKDKEYNLSESIYLISIMISMGIMLKTCILNISKSYDILFKQMPNAFFYKIIQISSSLCVTGIILLMLIILISRFISGIFYPKRNELLEFENNNIAYSLIRSGVLLFVLLVFSSSLDYLLETFIPNDIPFFR
jgi:hypothetical protein